MSGKKDMTVKVDVREVYGNTYYHPMNENAKMFASIAGTKTIAAMHMKHIRSLGFKIEAVRKALPEGISEWKETTNANV